MPLTDAQVNAIFERGNNFVRMNNLVEAIKDYSTVIANRPTSAGAYYNRGYARQYETDGLWGAIEDYNIAIKLNPQFAEAYANRALAYHQHGNYVSAIEDYNSALDLNPNLSPVYSNRGEAYFLVGNIRAAAEDFRKAHELKPGYRYALAGLAISLYELGKIDPAREYWNLLIAQDPHFKDAEWVRDELGWQEDMVVAAAALIEEL
jgi:tetratricopeptide (TPR) repeat protein